MKWLFTMTPACSAFALVSRAARRKTSEGTGPLIIQSELDLTVIAAEQDASEQPKQ
jgi:hypothetical protein